MDFGSITEISGVQDWKEEIFNSPSYIAVRTALAQGHLPDYCENCSVKDYGGGALHQTVNQYTAALIQIQDREQLKRAQENFCKAVESAATRQIHVSHNPCFANITCGSDCNIRCKFCYNCLMDYHPKAEDILRVVDAIHKDLIFVQVTGGEPLITKAGRELLRQFATGRYKFAVRLGTNAQWTDFDLLRPVNLAEVQISADGATKEVYEKVRQF